MRNDSINLTEQIITYIKQPKIVKCCEYIPFYVLYRRSICNFSHLGQIIGENFPVPLICIIICATQSYWLISIILCIINFFKIRSLFTLTMLINNIERHIMIKKLDKRFELQIINVEVGKKKKNCVSLLLVAKLRPDP